MSADTSLDLRLPLCFCLALTRHRDRRPSSEDELIGMSSGRQGVRGNAKMMSEISAASSS
eukprot:SAG31_NODE_2563_length_5473_cov_6.924823_2_plen_60_part_00